MTKSQHKEEAEILLTFGNDPELSVVRHLCIQNNTYGSETTIHNWKLDCQMDFFGLLTQRFKFLGTKRNIPALKYLSCTFLNISLKIKKKLLKFCKYCSKVYDHFLSSGPKGDEVL